MRKAYHVAEDCVNCARVRRLSPRCSSADTQSETACVSRRGQASLANMNASLGGVVVGASAVAACKWMINAFIVYLVVINYMDNTVANTCAQT